MGVRTLLRTLWSLCRLSSHHQPILGGSVSRSDRCSFTSPSLGGALPRSWATASWPLLLFLWSFLPERKALSGSSSPCRVGIICAQPPRCQAQRWGYLPCKGRALSFYGAPCLCEPCLASEWQKVPRGEGRQHLPAAVTDEPPPDSPSSLLLRLLMAAIPDTQG